MNYRNSMYGFPSYNPEYPGYNPSQSGSFCPYGCAVRGQSLYGNNMGYGQEMYYGENNGMMMPYYIADQMENDSEEEALERDEEYLRKMYPGEVRTIAAVVEEECDKLEYEGSCMFDEFPDQVTLRKIGERIYQKISLSNDKVEASEYRPYDRNKPVGGRTDWKRNIIDVLLFHEMHRRRHRHRRHPGRRLYMGY